MALVPDSMFCALLAGPKGLEVSGCVGKKQTGERPGVEGLEKGVV